MLWRYLKVQAYVLLCGAIGPFFLFLYFASDRDSFMSWFFWSGLVVTVADVVAAVVITAKRERLSGRLAALERSGVLALAHVVNIHETGTHINDQPLVKLDLQISGPGLQPFTSQDRVLASIARLPMITSRKLVALVDPATSKYEIDWERSALLSGIIPATFTLAGDDRTFDLSGQVEPLMEVLRILMAHGIGMNNLMDLQSNPAARQQVRDVVRMAAARQPSIVRATAGSTAVAESPGAPQTSTTQRLEELEALRSTGGITENEYATKRQDIIAGL
ncbi:SHOCT domain-containing protein [Mycobacterium deserti]|uniref:SHOCT domain-containing protein n=1 Tax=Mycobacterium deserti TaxID=2978347 RepID=A0ABT2MCK7_9MYCO|nr:SHOCT domain-containing protein [Mycobacterium deserti]MCT7660008.1 SHOCT domain-containing protein [Mycobacterium deserti]